MDDGASPRSLSSISSARRSAVVTSPGEPRPAFRAKAAIRTTSWR